MFFKELELTLPAENPDGSRSEPSGRGPFNGADVTVKDTKRYPDTDGWGYYNFHHFEPKAATASVRPKDECRLLPYGQRQIRRCVDAVLSDAR